MIKVECDSCKSPYQIEERRIPATGLKMRCSKCGSSILVQKPAAAGGDEEVDLPMPVAPRPKGGTEPMIPKAKAGAAVPAPLPAVKPTPAVPKPTAQLGKLKPAPAPAPSADLGEELDLEAAGFGEIDLPAPAKPTRKMAPVTPVDTVDAIDLPSPAKPTVRQMAAPVHMPGEEDEEDAALAAIEMTSSAELPSAKPTVRKMSAPAPEAFEVDLPAPAKPAPAKPVPGKPLPGKPAAAQDQKVTTPARPAAPGFGEIDLPAPVKPATPKPGAAKEAPAKRPEPMGFGEIDLPAAKGFGEIDLPSPAKPGPGKPAPAKPAMEADLPAPKGFGEIDLPLPAAKGGAGLPAAKGFGEIDLPAPAPARPRAKSSGEFDLPVVSGAAASGAFGEIDLPGIALPDDGGSGFGEIDLPPADADASFGDIELPLPPGQEPARPLKAGAALPAATGGAGFSDFGEIDLPLASEPPPPAPARAAASSTALSGSGSFALDHAFDATFGAGPSEHAAPAPAAPPKPAPAPSVGAGEEFSLGDAGIELGGDPLLDQAAISAPGKAARKSIPPTSARGQIGDEVELEPGDAGAFDAAAARKDKLTKTGRIDAPKAADPGKKPRRSRARGYVIGAVVLAAIGGGSLALLPDIGPFGAHFIGDRLNASSDAAALQELEKSVQASLDEDTFAAAAKALSAAKAAQAARPRHRPTAAYAAYVALVRGVRHGRRGDDETFAKQLLSTGEAKPSHELTLALAAQHTLAGKLDAARRVAKNAASEAPSDIDAACIVGEVELAAGSADAASAWKKAVAIKKSARTLYGLARAEIAAKDAASAEKSARAAIEASPQHAGARILLASILGRDIAHETEALELVAKVTSEGDVRAAASEAQIVAAYVETGRIHLARSRVTAAEQAFAAALKIDPRSVSALLGDAELFFTSGRYSQALLRFEEAAKADETSLSAKIGAGKTMLALERMKDAKELFAKLRTEKPTVAVVAYWLGRAEDALGNKKDAEALYGEAIKLGGADPATVEAYVALSALLAALGRGDEAQAKLAEASAKFTDLAALHRAKGDVLLAQGRFAEARTEFDGALAKEDDLGTRFRLGITLRRMRLFDEAGAAFEKIASVDKDFPSLALERGLLYEETGQSEKALEMYGDALKKAPTDIDLKMRVGSTQVMAGHAEQAEAILREVIKDRAGSADANHFLGRALLLKGGPPVEAIRFLERAVEIDGNRAEYYLYVAWAANELGQFQRAEQAVNRALELDHDLGDAYWQRGVLYSKQGRIKDALVDLETALQKRPSRFEAYATMAFCHQELAHPPEAIAAWQKAIAGNGSVAEWHYRLGKIYEGQGAMIAAAPELEKAAALLDVKMLPTWSWAADAYFLHGETAQKTGQKDKAIKAYTRFLELAPASNAYRVDAERALKSLGAPPRAP